MTLSRKHLANCYDYFRVLIRASLCDELNRRYLQLSQFTVCFVERIGVTVSLKKCFSHMYGRVKAVLNLCFCCAIYFELFSFGLPKRNANGA